MQLSKSFTTQRIKVFPANMPSSRLQPSSEGKQNGLVACVEDGGRWESFTFPKMGGEEVGWLAFDKKSVLTVE